MASFESQFIMQYTFDMYICNNFVYFYIFDLEMFSEGYSRCKGGDGGDKQNSTIGHNISYIQSNSSW